MTKVKGWAVVNKRGEIVNYHGEETMPIYATKKCADNAIWTHRVGIGDNDRAVKIEIRFTPKK